LQVLCGVFIVAASALRCHRIQRARPPFRTLLVLLFLICLSLASCNVRRFRLQLHQRENTPATKGGDKKSLTREKKRTNSKKKPSI
jgi:hypothetical protein